MARKPPRKTPDPLSERRASAAVKGAINAIKRAYKLGHVSRKEHGESLRKNPKEIIPKFAADLGYGRNSIEQWRHFSRGFTREDVRTICRWCRRYNFALGVTLICRVLRYDPEDRMKVLRRVIRERWTQARLYAEIRKTKNLKPYKGRARKLPGNRTEARQQIVARLAPALRWLEEVKDDGRFVGGLKRQVDGAIAALQVLVEAATG